MNYHVKFADAAAREMKKLDRYTAAMLMGWIRKNLEDCTDPRQHGKGLTANRSGEWRYRVGDYRILAQIQDDEILILLLHVGHRSTIYK